jgi:endonuclease/exonuclease/phosphatase family metal-dependent hydrolase
MSIHDRNSEDAGRARSTWFAHLLAFTCYAYLFVLLGSWALMRGVGEDFWMTGVALYFPRLAFGAPLLVLTPLILLRRARGLLWTQLMAAGVVVFPLMCLVLPHWPAAAAGTSMRVLSYNIASCATGADLLSERILHYAPDVIMLQEIGPDVAALREQLAARYPEVHVEDQFLLASRYPLRAAPPMQRLEFHGRKWAERFVRYELDTPLGTVAFYNLHPISVRWAFYSMRGMHVRTSLRSGTFWRGGAAEVPLNANFELRRLQLAAAAKLAAGDKLPRVLAGDTNVTDGSAIFARYFGDYQDGFRSIGVGFGYTFPSFQPWMRLDRVLASRELRFQHFEVGCGDASDHQCVVAQITRR